MLDHNQKWFSQIIQVSRVEEVLNKHDLVDSTLSCTFAYRSNDKYSHSISYVCVTFKYYAYCRYERGVDYDR